MAWIANKSMMLAGSLVDRGGPVPASVIQSIPTSRLGSLVRLNLIQEVPDPEPSGELCEVCGEGPFQRLASHMTRSHPDLEE